VSTIYGFWDPTTSTPFITRATLADMLGAAALADQAVSQVRDLLTDCLRVLGPDHPHTLATHDQLTFWQDQRGYR
jgi:hypothetical protein